MQFIYQDAVNLWTSTFKVLTNSLTTSVLLRASCSQYVSNMSCSLSERRTSKTFLFFRLGMILTWITNSYTLAMI